MSDSTNPYLIVQFGGWILMRIPTDPDPTDELRGVSGYTFAFGDEIDLDRNIYFKPLPNFNRSYTYNIGVQVTDAYRRAGGNKTTVSALLNAPLNLLDGPKLENRNWTLTPAGFEPIVPFNLLIEGNGISIRRDAPLLAPDPNNKSSGVKIDTRPVWEVEEDELQSFGAVGMNYEPATVGNATGIWDSLQVAIERRDRLQKDLDALQKKKNPAEVDQMQELILKGRIAQLNIGINNPQDRRVFNRYMIERFAFPMGGKAVIKGDQQKTLLGTLQYNDTNPTATQWDIAFWIGGWDPDALSAYISGALKIQYAS